MVIKDTIICEYDGIGMNEGQGKYRKWKDKLASGNEKITLLKVDDTKEIYYSPGSAKYYMGDLRDGIKFNQIFPDAAFIEYYNGREISSGIISVKDLLNEYKIKLINWDYAHPIKNSFPTNKK